MGTRDTLGYEDARARARVMKALGHPVRMMIVHALSSGDASPCDLHPLFKVRQPTLSRHIASLKLAGILTERRAGPRVLLHLATPSILRSLECALEVARADQHRREAAARKP